MDALGSWRATEAELRVSSTETYYVARAYGQDDGAWSATYCGPSAYAVEIDAQDDEGNAIWWESCGDARAACVLHAKLMSEGQTAEAAAAEVRMHTARDIEVRLGLAERLAS